MRRCSQPGGGERPGCRPPSSGGAGRTQPWLGSAAGGVCCPLAIGRLERLLRKVVSRPLLPSLLSLS